MVLLVIYSIQSLELKVRKFQELKNKFLENSESTTSIQIRSPILLEQLIRRFKTRINMTAHSVKNHRTYRENMKPNQRKSLRINRTNSTIETKQTNSQINNRDIRMNGPQQKSKWTGVSHQQLQQLNKTEFLNDTTTESNIRSDNVCFTWTQLFIASGVIAIIACIAAYSSSWLLQSQFCSKSGERGNFEADKWWSNPNASGILLRFLYKDANEKEHDKWEKSYLDCKSSEAE